jgi:hypothetical protein
MMKKLLILMLVLALVLPASAIVIRDPRTPAVVTRNVTWDIINGLLVGTNPAGVTGDPMNSGYGIDYGNSGTADFVLALPMPQPMPRVNGQRYPTSLAGPGNVPGALPPNAGNLAFVSDDTLWNGYDLSEGDLFGAGTKAGVWYVFNLDANVLAGLMPYPSDPLPLYPGNGGAWIDIYDYSVSALVPVGRLGVIPEPMTITLLALGGLLLRRRK